MFNFFSQKNFASYFWISSKFFLLFAIPLIILLLIGQYLDRYFEKLSWQTEQAIEISSVKADISSYFYESLTDLLILADNRKFFLQTQASNTELANQFQRIARISRNYHQLRFLDLKGHEIVRVNYSDGHVEQVSKERLQNKSKRPYFKKTINLKAGEVFVSQFNLNIEHGEIERPIRPVIRFATPVFDPEGKKRGILVLNYLGEKLLRKIELYDRKRATELFLLNEKGFYLYSKNTANNWGFLLGDKSGFSEDFKNEWSSILQNVNGQLINADGLFTYDTVNQLSKEDRNWVNKYTPASAVRIIAEEPFWRIISIVSQEQLFANSKKRFYTQSIGLTLLLIFFIPISYFGARSKIREKELLEYNSIYNQVVKQTDELIYITDAEGFIRYANHAAERHTGYKNSEVIGKTPRIFKSGKQPESFYQKLWKKIKEGKTFEGVFINRRKDGSLFYELKLITPLFDKDGKITRFVSTGRNITVDKEIQAQEMEASNRVAAGLLHHFGNFFNVIKGFSELAVMEIEENNYAVVSEYINEVITAVGESEKLLNRISFLASHKYENLPSINLTIPLENIVNAFRLELPENVEISMNFEEDIPNFRCDLDSLVTVMQALLSNAQDSVMYREKGKIEVSLKITEPLNDICQTCGEPLDEIYIEISIADNGHGISFEIQKYIWGPFFTTKDTANLVGQSPGLGLSIARGIVHANRGHILFDSKVNEGTTFRLLFPLTSGLKSKPLS